MARRPEALGQRRASQLIMGATAAAFLLYLKAWGLNQLSRPPGGLKRVTRNRDLLDEVTCSRKAVAGTALGLYRSTSEDFVDCILAAEHELSGRRILTFDKGLTRLVNERDGFPAV